MQRLLDSLGCSLSSGDDDDRLTIHGQRHVQGRCPLRHRPHHAGGHLRARAVAGVARHGPECPCPGAARSATDPSTCTCAASRRWARPSRWTRATSWPRPPPPGRVAAGDSKGPRSSSAGPTARPRWAPPTSCPPPRWPRAPPSSSAAACEPEIEDVGRLLIAMGAQITGLGSPRITIEGVESLHGTPDAGRGAPRHARPHRSGHLPHGRRHHPRRRHPRTTSRSTPWARLWTAYAKSA